MEKLKKALLKILFEVWAVIKDPLFNIGLFILKAIFLTFFIVWVLVYCGYFLGNKLYHYYQTHWGASVYTL